MQGNAASAFLHFAVLKNNFRKVAFVDFPGPAADLLNRELYDPAEAFAIPPGSLLYYDLHVLREHLVNGRTEVFTEKNPEDLRETIGFFRSR